MSAEESDGNGAIRDSLVAWLRWHAPRAGEIAGAPAECRPLLEAMSCASDSASVAGLATEIEMIHRLVADRAAAIEALKPFAEAASEYSLRYDPFWLGQVQVQHLWKAADVLRKLEAK